MDEETQMANFSYLECRKEDEVPDFVIEAFGYGLEKG
ncbi:hypothetical protein P343_13065 [Sporolactobacillus laevolacticus DSM 442]|uniref:Uncharacterized protein n=1 Tax=Sporolactobacillus laevolacticus DSM 442 TaxID=1395513 RepID=V6J3L0_9BACL|nr:hypothetical protein P343_13065 [Sporolactobacillus laevolacticus DSM 442]